jgi:hypothetical protein
MGFRLRGGTSQQRTDIMRRLARGAGFARVGLGPGQARWLRVSFKWIWAALFLWTGPGKPFSNIPKIIQISN